MKGWTLNDCFSVSDECLTIASAVFRISKVDPDAESWAKSIDWDLSDRVLSRLKAIHPEVFYLPINEIKPFMAKIEKALLDPIGPCSWDLEFYSGLKNEGILSKPWMVRSCYPKR